MATTTNYGWTTPDDTSLVKDGAAAIRTLGSSVDTTTKALNPSTTLGDIEYRSSTANTNTRLPIGSTGNVLTVAGGVPTWAAPGGVSTESYTQVHSAALPAATSVTISGLTGDKIRVYILDASSTNASPTYRLKPNSNSTAANYNKLLIGVQYSQAGIAYPTFTGDANGFVLANAGNDAGDTSNIYFEIDACKSTGIKTVRSYSHVSGTGGYGWTTGGTYQQAAAVTSIQITCSTGNFDGGTITVLESAV